METKLIYSKMIAILQDVGAIGKNKKNEQQGYKFRGIDDMYNALHPLFSSHGVFITSEVLESKREDRLTKSGGTLIYTIIKVKFSFTAEDGSEVASIIEGEAMDSGDKSTNKALSTALKYALMQMFLIPTDEKIDTEYQSHDLAPQKKALSELQYKKAIDRILSGEQGVIEKLNAVFVLSDIQIAKFKEAVEFSKGE